MEVNIVAQKEVLDRALYKKSKQWTAKIWKRFKRNVCGWCRKCKAVNVDMEALRTDIGKVKV